MEIHVISTLTLCISLNLWIFLLCVYMPVSIWYIHACIYIYIYIYIYVYTVRDRTVHTHIHGPWPYRSGRSSIPGVFRDQSGDSHRAHCKIHILNLFHAFAAQLSTDRWYGTSGFHLSQLHPFWISSLLNWAFQVLRCRNLKRYGTTHCGAELMAFALWPIPQRTTPTGETQSHGSPPATLTIVSLPKLRIGIFIR